MSSKCTQWQQSTCGKLCVWLLPCFAPLTSDDRLSCAVRGGDVAAFSKVAEQHRDVFVTDALHNLVSRLRYNVMRSGLRRISIAYSRISLQVWIRNKN